MRTFTKKFLAFHLFGIFLAAWSFSGWGASKASLLPENPKCEYRVNPLGVDASKPRLSWTLAAKERGAMQAGYQILVATSIEKLAKGKADLWDTGKVESKESLHIVYVGKPLVSRQRAYWKVRVWDEAGNLTDYTKPAWWEMGLLSQADWKASWISRKPGDPVPAEKLFEEHPAPLLRKEFAVDKKIARARLYVSGLGYYEMRLNGQHVGDHVLDPGLTSYAKRVLYSTYDVTSQIHRGKNAMGAMLGNGWFNPLPLKMWGKINIRESMAIGEPRLIAQLVLEFADGSTQIIGTDETWKAGDAPILRNSIYLGEYYDARREQKGWDAAGFDDSGWKNAVLAEGTLGELRAQDAPPIRVTRTVKAVKVTEPKPGVFIFDLGQNFAGWARLKVKGEAGTRVKMRYGELLYKNGMLNAMTSVCGQIKRGGPDYRYDGVGLPQTAFQLDEYTLKGGAEEIFTPHFTFHGFRYVEVTGFPGKPALDAVEGLRLNSDVEPIGEFSCSNEMFNRIQQMVLWSELSNLFSVESDCPHREKFGYGGDIVAASEMAMFNFDMSRFYAKVVDDFSDAARANGGFTETAPFVGISDAGLGDGVGPIGWGTAHPLLQRQLYQYYGDRRVIEENFERTGRWLGLLNEKAQDFILDNGISDHESLVPKPRAVTGTAFYYFNARMRAEMASILGKSAEADSASALAEKIKTAFNEKFLQRESGKYDSGTQCCQAVALYMGLVPTEMKVKAIDMLVSDIQAHQGHLTTGIFGTKYMLDALTEAGRVDVAYNMVNQRDFPGWGHMLANGATTLWEHWEFSDNTFSHNHPMFGSVSEWFYKGLAGINPAPNAIGFDNILIRPQTVNGLDWVKASYNSVRGKIVSEWKRENGKLMVKIIIPANVSARISIPADDFDSVFESGQKASNAKGVKYLGKEGKAVLLVVKPGAYEFAVGGN